MQIFKEVKLLIWINNQKINLNLITATLIKEKRKIGEGTNAISLQLMKTHGSCCCTKNIVFLMIK